MAKKKTYYDPQNGQHYYHGEDIGAANWSAPESVKDESYINQYNYTPSYNAYRQYLEEEERRRKRLAEQNILAPTIQVEDGQKPGQFDTQAARAKAEPRVRFEQELNNIVQYDPKFKNMSAEEKYNMFAKEINDQMATADYSPGMQAWAKNLQGDPEFDRMSEDEKKRQYMNYLDRTANENGTLSEEQRAELSNYKYNGLSDREKSAIDAVMRIQKEGFEDYTEGAKETQFADPTGRGAWSQKRYQESNQALDSRQAANERTLNEVRDELRHLGWDDKKIETEIARYQELADWNKVQDNRKEISDRFNDPNLSAVEKALVGAGYTAADIIGFLPRNIDMIRNYSTERNPSAYGYNTSSKYASMSRNAEEGINQTRNLIDSPVGQTIYDIGVSSGESMSAVLMSKLLGPLGESASLVPFASSAFDSGYRDAVNRGFSQDQAQAYGLAVGGIEALTEIVSLDKLAKMADGKKIGRNLLTRMFMQAGIEGSEEVASEVLGELADWAAVKVGGTGKTQRQLDVEAYMEQGMSQEEAESAAKLDFIKQVGMAALSGAGAALPNTAVASAVGAVNSRYGKNLNQAIADRYQSLEVEGDSEYEQMLKADKERYQNNPTQFVVDNYKATDKQGERIKAGLQEIADKEREGKKLSVSDKNFIAENAQVNDDFINKLYDINDQSNIPYEYRDVKYDVTEDDARTMLAQAAKDGDTEGFIKAMQMTRNSSDENVAKNAEEIISQYSGMAETHGITKESMGQAMLSKKKAYIAGLNGEDLGNMSAENQIAYNEGRKAYIENKTKTITNASAVQNAVMGTKDGSTVKLTGRFDSDGVVTADGNSVKVEDLDLTSESAIAKAYQYADNYKNVNTKNDFMLGIQADTNIKEYNRDFKKAYDLGLAGVSEENMKQGITTLDDDTRMLAYEAGQREAKIKATNEIDKAWGVVHKADGVFYNDANVADKGFVQMFDNIAAKLGVDIHVVDEMNDKAGARGSFDPKTNTITVNASKAMAVFHEIGEFSEVYNKAGYDELKHVVADLSVKKFGADNYSRMLKAYETAYGNAGLDSSADEMSGEMFNDVISAMLSTDKGAQAFANYLADNYDAQQAKTLGQQAAGIVKKLANAIKKLASPEKGNLSGEYQEAVYQIADELSEHADKFISMLDKAVQNYQKAAGIDTTEQAINETTELVGIGYDADDGFVYPADYSLETWNASEYQTDRKAAAADLSKVMKISQKKALKYIDDINSIAKIIADDRVRLDYESDEGSAVVSNSDYGASVDFSTICKKRLLYTGTLQQIQKQIGNRVITVDDYLAIRQAMIRDNLETTCGCCYVEGSRAKLGGFMKEFIRKYAATKPKYVPTMYDVTMPDGIRDLRANHPEVYQAREFFLNNYGKINKEDTETLFSSQGKPKDYTERKAYKGEILKMFKNKPAKVAEKNLNGGLRMQSFSDFEVVNLLDCMQVITDMSRCGLAGQAYTKVKNFADALGNTGLKINCSIMAKDVDKNGNLILDEVNGMKRADAEYLRNKYSKNVGTIIVCFTDEQIKAAMRDDFIDFIIPFHRSQWQKSQFEALGLPKNTRDYTNYQNDRIIQKNGSLKKADHSYMSNEYWDYSKTGRENAEKYIDMCNKDGKAPVFDFLLEKDSKGKYYLPEGADGYFKLLIDFKMYDNDGVGSPQMPVRPDFSLEECKQMLMEYEGGHESFPVDQKIADEFTKKIVKREKEFKYSLDVDSEGNKLTDGQKEYFKDSKITDDQGHLKVMYHGSPNQFTVFDPKKLGGKNGTAEGFGIYFADTQEVTKAYGDEQLKGYLNVTHPASSFEKTIKANDLSKLIKATAIKEAEQMVADGEYDTVDDAIKDSWVSNYVNTYETSMDAAYKQVADEILKLNGNDMDIIQEVMAGLGIRDYAQAYDFYETLTDTLGIDGYVTNWTGSNGETSGIVVAFNSNQFKNIDNENPTSNEDIRYSIEVDDNGHNFVNIQDDIISNLTDDDQIKDYVRTYLLEYFPRIDMNGFELPLNSDSRSEYTDSRYSQRIQAQAHNLFMDKMRMAANLDEIVNTADGYKYEKPKHKRKDDKIGFVRGNIPVRVGSNDYIADVVLADRKNAGLMFYDIINLVPTKIKTAAKPISPQKQSSQTAAVPKQSVAQNGQNIKHSLNVGYHAGNLGKSESLFQQSGGRNTGHFGTGTYFVGDESKINDLSGYKDRPHHAVDFSKYNLYRPSTAAKGLQLHDFLGDIDAFYKTADDAIRSEREWESRKDELEYVLDADNFEGKTITKAEALDEARRLFGANELQQAISHELGDGYWYGNNDIYDEKNDRHMTYAEAVEDWEWERFADMIANIIWDNRYAPNYIGHLESFDKNLATNAMELFGITEDRAKEIIKGIREEIKAANYGYEEMRTADSAATRFMKALGYEGIDVRGLNGLDNTTYGSVIYDLKGEDLEQKIANGARYSIQVDSDGRELSEGQQRYFNDTKVVDDEGRLKVMYHGTTKGGFTVFDPEFSDDKTSLFFSDSIDVSESYVGKRNILNPYEFVAPIETAEDAVKYMKSIGYKDFKKEDVPYLPDGTEKSLEEMESATEDRYGFYDENGQYYNLSEDMLIKIANFKRPKNSGIYSVYLNIKNPYEIDARGNNWSTMNGKEEGIPDGFELSDLQILPNYDDEYEDDVYTVSSVFQDFYEIMTADEIERELGKDIADVVRRNGMINYQKFYFNPDTKEFLPDNTRTAAAYAKDMGYDGVIIRNVRDNGGASANDTLASKPSTVAIAFNSEQVKDIDNLNPTSSEDIRYALDLDEGDSWVDFDSILGRDTTEKMTEDKAVNILEKGMEALKNQNVDVPKLRNLALKLRNEYGSGYNVNELTDRLQKAFAYMQTEDHVDYQTMMGILKDIARPVIESSGEKVGEQEYKDFLSNFKGRKIKLTAKQKEEVKYALGSYGKFRNAIMPITISDNGDTTLDQIWDELVEQSGYMLDRDAVEGEMPLNLLDTLQAMRPTVRNDFGGDLEDMSRDLAMRIVQEYIEGETAKQMGNEIKEYRARLKKDYQERMKELQGKVNAEARARNKRRAEQAKEREDVRRLKHDIKIQAKKLFQWVEKPTEGKSVPHNMVVPVMQFLQAIDFVDPVITMGEDGKWHTRVFDRVDYDNGRKKFVYHDLSGDSYEDVLKQFNEAIGRGEGSKEQRSWAEKMQGMREIYDKVLKDSDFEDNSMDFLMQTLDAQGLAEDFDQLLADHKGELSMNHLNSRELTLIDNITKNIFHAVNQGNKAFSSNVDINNLAQSTIQDSEGKELKSRNSILKGMYKMLRLDNVTPRTFFKLLGSRGSEVYKFLRGGLNQEIVDLKKASEFMENAMQGVDAKKWTGPNATIHEFALTNGSVKMTDAQILGLYYTIRRNGGLDRIKGGIVVDDIKTNKDRIRKQNAIHLTESDIKKIESVLTPEQIELGKKMQQYMASDCSAQGNDTSLKLYGFKKFTDDTYYPWTVDKDTVPTNNTSENIPMFTGIERSGFTKQLKEGASNPLVIRDIFDVFTDHVAQMAAYHGYAASVKDTLRWMNYREKSSGNGFDTWITNKSAINKLSGDEGGVGYITKLLLDINKANKSQYIGNFTDRLIGNYKAAAVGANLRVIAQQPTAYFRALNQIDAKYLFTVNPATAIKNIKKSQEQSPISWWKSKGYYETNLGQPIKEIVTGIATPAEKAKDIMMSPAGWADDVTWGFLYTAVENEQRAKYRGQKITPEEFRKAVNDRFDEVVDNTQVVDSTLHRSQYMRSNDRLNKLQTAFMAEPTKSYNMLLEAGVEDMREKSGKRTARAVTAFLLSALATSAAAAVVDAMRKNNDDEDWWETWLNNLKENMADNINPFNLLPVVKDLSAAIYNQITGTSTYGQSGNRFDIEAISSVMNAVNAWQKMLEGESNKTPYGFVLTNLKPISQITGIPAYNLVKDAVALYNSFFENIQTTVSSNSTAKNERKKELISDLKREKSDETLDETIVDAINHGVSIYDLKGAVQSEYKNKYFDAFSEGNEEEARDIANTAARAYARMGLTDEEIDEIINDWQEEVITYSALDKAIASGEGIVEEAQRVMEAKDEDRIIKHIMDRFSQTVAFEDTHETESEWRKNVETALQTVDGTLDFDKAQEEALAKKKAQEEKAAETAKNQAMKNDFFDAVEKKDGSAGRKALETMKKEGIEAKTVKSATSTKYHDMWKEAKSQAEKDKAKSDWKSAYTLINTVYGSKSNDLDKTWNDWVEDQNKK